MGTVALQTRSGDRGGARGVLLSEKPKLRYLVETQWEGDRVLHALVEKLLDENDNPQHNYSREQLVELLDRKIEERRAVGE